MYIDVFNGDADGIIALLMLRLNDPQESQLITGVKRDINLVKRVEAARGDTVTILDISMLKNIQALGDVLATGASVFYADHHQPGDIPQSDNLDANINLDANCCTALIIDSLLNGKYRDWAITAAYGDNLIVKADEFAASSGYSKEQAGQLKELGTLLNYNGYGSRVSDLHFDPAELFKALLKYSSPFDVISDKGSPFYILQKAYKEDMDKALAVMPVHQSEKLKVFELADVPSSRRISGVYGNWLANHSPDSAHVVLTQNSDTTYTVSLRAPLNNKQGAGKICLEFPTGGGREAAAGVNELPSEMLDQFIEAVEAYY